MKTYSEEESESLAREAYAGRSIQCPRCDGPIERDDIESASTPITALRLRCKRCGTFGTYGAYNLAAMELKWTTTEKIRIVERYWAQGRVRCPSDDAILVVRESNSLASPQTLVSFRCPHCGRYFRSNEVDNVPDSETYEGTFEEVSLIGRGGMGEVHLVRLRSTGERFAAKVIHPKYLKSIDTVKRFHREARILERLEHPNVLRLKQTFLSDKGGVLITPYLSGGDLLQKFNDISISTNTLLDYLQDVAVGLEYCHAQGVVHRDLKPENVLIDPATPKALISDFGLARLVNRDSPTITASNMFLGTRKYAAPELYGTAKGVTTKCDWYSFGVIGYDLICRGKPWSFMDLSSIAADLREAMGRYLNNDPDERPASGNQLLIALRKHLGSPVLP